MNQRSTVTTISEEGMKIGLTSLLIQEKKKKKEQETAQPLKDSFPYVKREEEIEGNEEREEKEKKEREGRMERDMRESKDVDKQSKEKQLRRKGIDEGMQPK
ncbi:hypothetical protein PRIPAC_76899 [Pristionchus pacificus]|uniref:Uncharacterized protein n=1 Tax=Pristionchus pacificus TaxID=54126 RepID=A0A2A6C332_PRIPA|nr:hypothetical protein PRIPAC_76899 [Pristionchus pacificus]|eukprot:PDM72540.1 hypothetical protein PRIPAC_38974 [Pristionchus pacificus]